MLAGFIAAISIAIQARAQLSSGISDKLRLNQEVDSLHAEVTQLRNQQPAGFTMFEGVFPLNLPAITKLVESTKSRLVIRTDFCAYGHYSAPAGFLGYKAALIAAKARADVQIHVYDDPTSDKMTASQFGLDKPDGGAAAFAEERANRRFKDYFSFHEKNGTPKAQPQSVAEFVSLMRREQVQCVQDLRAVGISVRPDIANPLPIFMWLRDDDEAIISVYNLGADSREASLKTRDKGLLNVLNDIAHRPQ
jgi:hypothetical protein